MASPLQHVGVDLDEALMLRITPVRERISERFPVASFVVGAPPDRYFEVACATDPHLFRPDQQHRRTPGNFASSRVGGLLRAPAGQATYIIPPQQLRRFAGSPRLYYAMAAFRGARGEDPILTVAADRLEQTPSIQIAPDFTGRSLDRGKLEPASARYGAAQPGTLTWGGDAVLPPRSNACLGNDKPTSASTALSYDDGFDAALWDAPESAAVDEDGEPSGHEDAPAYGAATVEPSGFEDAPAWLRAGAPAAMPLSGSSPNPTTARYGGGAPAPAHSGSSRPSPHHERYGSVTGRVGEPAAVALRVDPPVHGGEADGYEDVPDLVRNLGPRYRAFGSAAPTAIVPAPEGPARFPDFSDDLGGPEPLPEIASALSSDEVFTPDDPRHRLRVIHRVAVAEHGGATYAAINPDNEYNDPSLPEFYQRKHVGLSWGFIQFAQRYGSLGAVLVVCNRRDPAAFTRIFGAHNGAPAGEALPAELPAGHLLRVTNADDEEARVAPVTTPAGDAAVELWREPWRRAFGDASAVVAFQEAQREVADRCYYEPYIDVLAGLGLTSVRGHAMFVDRSIHMGGGGAVRWIVRTAGPIRSQALLRNALAHLGHADLRSFQATVGVPADGQFGPLTHVALVKALRLSGNSPVALPSEETILGTLVSEAERMATTSPSRIWRLTARRLRELRDDSNLTILPPEPRLERQ